MKKDNSTSVLITLVRLLKVKVTKESIYTELQKHPDHPSLFAISDVLNYFKVPNAAYQVEYQSLEEIPVPFLVRLSSSGGEFAVVNKRDEQSFYLSNERWNNQKMDRNAFKHLFSGTVLYAEADVESGESDYTGKHQQERLGTLRIPLLISFSLLVVILTIGQTSYMQVFDWRLAFLTLFKSSGLVTSILLLMHSVDSNNPLIERLCIGDDKNCNAILTSKAAKVTKYLSWSEVGFFYYSGTWLALLFYASSSSMLQVLALLSVCCLPYSIYSIYYQARVAKQWCVFCLAIQTLFWLEGVAVMPTLLQPLEFPSVNTFIKLFICLSVPVLLWGFLKPFLMRSMELDPLKVQLKNFKYNGQIFNKILKEQKKKELLDESDTIVLGNMEAENTLTIVSNPFCQPCSRAHRILDGWLSEKDNFKLQILFSARNTDDDPITAVAKHLHRLSKENRKALKEAVHDWYENKYEGLEGWKRAYPVTQERECPELDKQKSWCDDAEIKGTPTVFLNGYRLPSPWQLEDIKYLI